MTPDAHTVFAKALRSVFPPTALAVADSGVRVRPKPTGPWGLVRAEGERAHFLIGLYRSEDYSPARADDLAVDLKASLRWSAGVKSVT